MSSDGIAAAGPGKILRRQTRRHRRRRRLLGIAAIVAALLVLTWVVVYSPLLVSRQVLVKGSQLADQQQILDAAQVPMGVPLAQLDTRAIAGRVSALPAIAVAKVSPAWPSSVEIQVTDRSIAYQRPDGNQYQWIDAHGVIFHSSPDRQQVPVADLPSTQDQQLLADVATVVTALPPDVRGRVQSLQASSPHNILVVLDRQQSIFWGSADQSDLKASLLSVLLAQPGNVIDVSSPSHPAIK